MKHKAISIVFILIIVTTGSLWLAKQKIGDVRPAVLPPAQEIEEVVEKQAAGEPVDFPLQLPDKYLIGIFAKNLGSPRDLEFSPNGTLLVSIHKVGKVVALPDKDHDGKTDEVKDILRNLNKPHGLAFHNGQLFVAEETRVVRYNWDQDNLKAIQDKILFDLPAGERHVTRSLAIQQNGTLFVSIGSTCDTCFEKNPWHGSIIISDIDGNNPQIFATGLRNAVFITLHPITEDLWATEMGRDFLGDDLPPDEINIVYQDRDYGWPVCYGDRVYDSKFGQRSLQDCANTMPPVAELQAHVAPLGLAFIDSPQFPDAWQGDLLVSYHGSWNRTTPVGYKVVRLSVEDRTAITAEEDFISGWLRSPVSNGTGQGSQTLGRPVDLAFDQAGNLYISDDKAGVVYIVNTK